MSPNPSGEPVFFASAEAFRQWLEENHASAQEIWVGYYKKGSGQAGITYPESVDEALCFGWIDGIRKSVDAGRYTNRFTPRRPGSNWSAVNVRRVQELIAEGRMRPAGLRAFEARKAENTGIYGYEQQTPAFDPALQAAFEANPVAWAFFQQQPPSYRRIATYWVMSAKREETRRRRMDTLIADSAAGRRLAAITSPARRGKAGQEG